MIHICMIALHGFEGAVIFPNAQRTETRVAVCGMRLCHCNSPLRSHRQATVTSQPILQRSMDVLPRYWHFTLCALTDCPLKYYSGIIF